MRRELRTVVLLSLVFALPARAQQPAPSVSDTADRPGFADSPTLLGRGQIQSEFGFAWEHDGGSTVFTVPQMEVHAGLVPRLEVSVTWNGLVSTAAPESVSHQSTRTNGGDDIRLGAKFGLVNRSSLSAALIAYADLPVGSSSVSSGYADPQLRFAWEVPISDRFGLSGTADLGAEREDDGRVRAKPAASAALGATLIRALGGYLGVVAESPPASSTPDAWSVETGFVLPLGARTQLDVWGSRRVSDGRADWLLGAGFVRRLR
jgi:hypothetical protein